MITPVRTDPFIFRGRVSGAGYEWLKGEDGKPRLVPRHLPGVGSRPCDAHPGLFREFAELNPTREAIRGFAEKYGDIFNRYESGETAVRGDGTVGVGAALDTWKQETGDMRVLVGLWDQIRGQQLAELQKIIKRTGKELRYVIETPKRKASVTLAHAYLPEGGLDSFDPEDVVLPAQCALQLEINKRISETPTVPRLTWTPDYFQRIIFEPSNLIAAMWMQFAQAVTGEFQLKKCVCGKYFQVGPGGRRADATTCGDACRQRKKRGTGKSR
jgi:hypothetical protein